VNLDTKPIVDIVTGYRTAKILLVAVYHDLFTLIDGGTNSVGEICQRARLNPRATEILLEALVPLGFLEKTGARYHNSAESERFLVHGKPEYLGNNLKYQEMLWEAWGELREILQYGQTQRPLETLLSDNPGFSQEYILGMHNISQGPARELAEIVPLERAQKMLDVGAGPGTFSLEFLKRYPTMNAYLLDLPGTIEVAESILAHHPESSRVRFITGNYLYTDFGYKRFDLALLSHVTHNESEENNRFLIWKTYRALRPGGFMVVHDFMHNDAGATKFNGIFSVHMLVYTRHGRVYSVQEYEKWLRHVGFKNIRKVPIAKNAPNPTMAILAQRP